jgi:hypothetical protein
MAQHPLDRSLLRQTYSEMMDREGIVDSSLDYNSFELQSLDSSVTLAALNFTFWSEASVYPVDYAVDAITHLSILIRATERTSIPTRRLL